MSQLVNDAHSTEDSTYAMFKELLLRHAIHRPPHSLAIFNLKDVKTIDLFCQDTFFRHFEMYKYALTVKSELSLQTTEVLTLLEPSLQGFEGVVEIPARDIDQIYQYLTERERAEFERQKEYMLHGPGRIETVVNAEMEKLYKDMQDCIEKQDADFMAKLPQKK